MASVRTNLKSAIFKLKSERNLSLTKFVKSTTLIWFLRSEEIRMVFAATNGDHSVAGRLFFFCFFKGVRPAA